MHILCLCSLPCPPCAAPMRTPPTHSRCWGRRRRRKHTQTAACLGRLPQPAQRPAGRVHCTCRRNSQIFQGHYCLHMGRQVPAASSCQDRWWVRHKQRMSRARGQHKLHQRAHVLQSTARRGLTRRGAAGCTPFPSGRRRPCPCSQRRSESTSRAAAAHCGWREPAGRRGCVLEEARQGG